MRIRDGLRLPAPVDVRSLLELFAFYDERFGLDRLLDPIDLAGASSRQLHYSVFGQFEATAEPGEPDLRTWLHSAEFQQNIMRLVLHAYPNKRRLLFVHTPKCAGADLTTNLAI